VILITGTGTNIVMFGNFLEKYLIACILFDCECFAFKIAIVWFALRMLLSAVVM